MDNNNFPMLKKDYIYFNSASTALKPKVVIDKIVDYYENYSVNTNRGVDSLGYKVTMMYEEVRETVADFIGAEAKEIIFTRGTTESLNLVASSFGEYILKPEDEVIVSIHEHHANFIPWQELCKRVGAKFIIVPTKEDGTVDKDILETYMNEKTKIVALNHVSNVFGGTNDLKELAKVVHKYNAYFVVDGAQGIVKERINLKDLDVDFYAFSGHKLYGPMGVGVLFGKYNLLEKMYPIMFGGEMIDVVKVDNTTYKKPPYCFEAGTMMIPEILALGDAIKYVENITYEKIEQHIKELRSYLVDKLTNEIDNIEILNKDIIDSHLITFNIKGIHAHDVASHLDKYKIIVRAGHHCAEPLLNSLGCSSLVRISFGIYNTKEDCDKLIEVLKKAGDYIDVLFN